MKTSNLYCPVCKKHTPHVHYVDMYATGCSVCHTQTSQLERSHVENLHYTTPDGIEATVVHNTPDQVTFFIPKGKWAGYLHYDKHRNKWVDATEKALAS